MTTAKLMAPVVALEPWLQIARYYFSINLQTKITSTRFPA